MIKESKRCDLEIAEFSARYLSIVMWEISIEYSFFLIPRFRIILRIKTELRLNWSYSLFLLDKQNDIPDFWFIFDICRNLLYSDVNCC